MHQHEAAGAVGVFDHAGFEAGLAKQGALLVARYATDRNGSAQQVGVNLPKHRAGGLHRGQHAGRNLQRPQQVVVPLVGMHIEQQGARGIADIRGVHRALGELPEQPAVYRAKGQFAVGRLLARSGHVVQQPFQFGAGKIGIQQQAGLGLDGGS